MIEAEQGEFVMRRDAVESIGIENLNRMNQGGGGAVTVNISAPLVDETVVDTIIPAINEAVRRGETLARS
jgi:DNA-binding protein YbaB